MKANSKKALQIRSIAGPSIGIAGAGISVAFRYDGKRKTVRLSPMTSRAIGVRVPNSRGSVFFTLQADAGDGNWPVATSERVIRRKG